MYFEIYRNFNLFVTDILNLECKWLLKYRSESTPATSDADISIVKVESEVSFDEQFHGDDPGVTFEPDDHAGDWNREDTSNEESNASEDKMPQWMTDSMKGK